MPYISSCTIKDDLLSIVLNVYVLVRRRYELFNALITVSVLYRDIVRGQSSSVG